MEGKSSVLIWNIIRVGVATTGSGASGRKRPASGQKRLPISADLAREGPNFGSQRGLGVSYKKER